MRRMSSSSTSLHRSINQGYTKRLWIRVNVPEPGGARDNLLYNQATCVDVDSQDTIDDVKTKFLRKVQNTDWARLRNNTMISIGFYYKSSFPPDSFQEDTKPKEREQEEGVFTITYSEYQDLLGRNNLRAGKWSHMHHSINRVLHSSYIMHTFLPGHSKFESDADEDMREYCYRVVLMPDQLIVPIYRDLYGASQKSEDALTVFFSRSHVHSSLPSDVMLTKELLDPIQVFPIEFDDEDTHSEAKASPSPSVDNIAAFQETHPQSILLLPKGYKSDNEVDSGISPILKAPTIDTTNIPGDEVSSVVIKDQPLTEEEVGLSMARARSPDIGRPPSRKLTPSLDKQIALPKEKVFPRINVLIVEDNAINQAILGLFLKKNGISYKVAKNGLEAVERWKEGESHLILMDLQLPLLSGLEATKKIRELERVNGIGKFTPSNTSEIKSSGVMGSSTSISSSESESENTIKMLADDLSGIPSTSEQLDRTKFRSPVIILALTASYAQNDRTNALLAGCNDYLTKPVNLEWLSKKLTEWGCMQALIDFDGWTQGQRRMTDNVLKPQLAPTRKSQTNSTRSVPRVSSISSSNSIENQC